MDLLHLSTDVEIDLVAAEIEEDVILAHHQDHPSDAEDDTRILVPDLPAQVIPEDERDLIPLEDVVTLVVDVVILAPDVVILVTDAVIPEADVVILVTVAIPEV